MPTVIMIIIIITIKLYNEVLRLGEQGVTLNDDL